MERHVKLALYIRNRGLDYMSRNNVTLKFDTKFVGELESNTGKVKIGLEHGDMTPYQLLFGSLGSCFYATFLSVSNKMKLTFTNVVIEVTGTKRIEVPQTLEHVTIQMTIFNGSDEAKLTKAAALGAKHCSIYETISKVSKMDLIVLFEKTLKP